MKEEIKGNSKVHYVVENVRKIMHDENLTQKTMSEFADISESQMSKVFNGSVQLSIWQLSNIASSLQINIIDLFTYPKKFVDSDKVEMAERISITFEVSPDKREHLLKMVTEK